MKDYYKFESSNYVNYGIVNSPKLGESSVMQGRYIDPEKLPELVFEHSFPTGEAIPHFLTGGTVLASKRLIDVISNIGVDNYQAFPVVLINTESREVRKDYYLFNVLGLLSATDTDSSKYDEIMKGDGELPLVAFKEMVIDSKKIHGQKMFRLAEEPISLIVDQDIVAALKTNKPDEGWGVVVEEIDVV